MDAFDEIKKILGRDVEFEQITYKGQLGYYPIYLNFNFRNDVTQIFSPTKEEAAQKFLAHIQQYQGDTDDTEPGSEQSSSSED